MPVVLQYCDSVQHPFPHGLVQGADVAVVAGVGADVGKRVGVGVGGGVGGALSSVGIQLMPQADMHDTACCMHGEACGEVSNHSLHASLGPCC